MTVIAPPKSDLAKEIAARAEGKTGGIKELAEARSDVFQINPYLIKVEPNFNARSFDNPEVEEHIDGLAQSIAAGGVRNPLRLRKRGDSFTLVDGECRLRATFRAIEVYGAEIRSVPVRIQDRSTSEADAVLSLVVDNSGLSLSPLEQGSVFKRLAGYGWTTADIASKAGVSSTRVTQLLDLQSLPEQVKSMIRTGQIAATLAAQIAREHDFDEAKTIQCVEAAAAQAQSCGKKKVTARMVSGGERFNLRRTLGSIFGRCMAEEVEEGEIVVAMSTEDWNEVQRILKLSKG